MEMSRCGNCMGKKKMAGLGGVAADCNLCKGVGQIVKIDVNAADISKEIETAASEIIKQVAIAKAVRIDKKKVVEAEVVQNEEVIKVDAKRAIYRKKSKE